MASFSDKRKIEEIIMDYSKLIEKEIDVKIFIYMVPMQKELIQKIVILI